jgi:hypothetical protein
MENEVLKELLRMQLQFNNAETITKEKNQTKVKLSQEDLNEIIEVVKDAMCDSVYDSMSIDDHELLWSKNGVEVHNAIGYYYADILGLDDEQFTYIETKIKEVK